jgi:hypothetical protein
VAKHKVSELTGALLDSAVAKAEGYEIVQTTGVGDWIVVRVDAGEEPERYCPRRWWLQGGPIIERERIAARPTADGWEASAVALHDWSIEGPTFLIAAMRAYVASKFGDEIDLPD